MKLTQQKHLAGKRIERAGQLFIRPGLLFRRHRWSLNDILPARHLIRLVSFPKLLVVIVNGFGRYRVLERIRLASASTGPRGARAHARPGMDRASSHTLNRTEGGRLWRSGHARISTSPTSSSAVGSLGSKLPSATR